MAYWGWVGPPPGESVADECVEAAALELELGMTTPQTLDVVIIGGGIGGLCLAQGLHHAGIPVTVYERTEARTDWLQGYRIHINPHGSRALHDCLPPAAWQRFLDSVSVNDGGFGFATEQLHDLLRFAGPEILPDAGPADAHYGASRISLREVLLSGLDGVVRLGKTFERYETAADGRVIAHFADRTSATADVLIGADGANSRVRQQLLPDAERIDTGILAIAGKHRLDGAELPRVLREDANIVIPTGRGFLFTARWQPDRNAIVPESVPGDFLLDNASAYSFWAYADAASEFPRTPHFGRRRPAAFSAAPHRRLGAGPTGAHRRLRPANHQRGPGPQRNTRRRMADRTGDAARRRHPNMTPMAGIGANTALRDAELLRRRLITVAAGDRELLPALHEYEDQMRKYGFTAVRQSLRNARQAGSANRLARGASAFICAHLLWARSAVSSAR